MKKKISILGSTGSIGLSSLKIINKKKSFFEIYLFSANKNFKLICNQIKIYKPKYFVISNYNVFKKVKRKFSQNRIIILNSFSDLKKIKKSDITITAIPGIDGLLPTVSMIKFSKKVLIANKESIICGWNLIKKNSKTYNTKLIPIDSEHYSIFKVLEKNKISEIKKIFLTASGGPFLNYKLNKLKKVKFNDALRHPKWKMGKKISLDSSTLMNKLFELVEAQKLFNISNECLEIIIHPNSLVHAIIEFKNGFSFFVYHKTSMLIPISNAIFDGNINIENFYDDNKKNEIESLTFKKVDSKIFPTIKLKNLINKYPSSPIIINSSNEVLTSYFMREKIPFFGIFKTIMAILNDRNYKKYAIRKPNNFKEIINIHNWAKKKTIEKINKLNA